MLTNIAGSFLLAKKLMAKVSSSFKEKGGLVVVEQTGDLAITMAKSNSLVWGSNPMQAVSVAEGRKLAFSNRKVVCLINGHHFVI